MKVRTNENIVKIEWNDYFIMPGTVKVTKKLLHKSKQGQKNQHSTGAW